jgi:hypothetical protein
MRAKKKDKKNGTIIGLKRIIPKTGRLRLFKKTARPTRFILGNILTMI